MVPPFSCFRLFHYPFFIISFLPSFAFFTLFRFFLSSWRPLYFSLSLTPSSLPLSSLLFSSLSSLSPSQTSYLPTRAGAQANTTHHTCPRLCVQSPCQSHRVILCRLHRITRRVRRAHVPSSPSPSPSPSPDITRCVHGTDVREEPEGPAVAAASRRSGSRIYRPASPSFEVIQP